MAEQVAETEASGRLPDEAVHRRLARIDELLDRVSQVPGPTSDAAVEAVQLLTEVYGEALARTFAYAGEQVTHRCAEDELVQHLMVLHGLHPDPVHERVAAVLESLRTDLEAKGGTVELLGIEGDMARVRFSSGGCGSCASSGDPLQEALAETILALAPELSRVEQEPASSPARGPALIPVEALLRPPAGAGGAR